MTNASHQESPAVAGHVATTGAMIIGEFVGDAAWVHLDIASSANSFGDHGGSDKGYNPKGPNGSPGQRPAATGAESGGVGGKPNSFVLSLSKDSSQSSKRTLAVHLEERGDGRNFRR